MRPRVFIWGETGTYENYVRAIEAAGGRVSLSGAQSVGDCDALLLPGGGDVEPWRYGQKNTASRHLEPERDQAELELLARFTVLKKPILGICRGIQTINVFFGGTLCQDIPGHCCFDGIDRLHTVHTALSAFRDFCGETCIVNSAHHQTVDVLGSGLQAVQWAPDGTIEAVCHKTLPVWGVQWHPERLPGETGRQLFRAFLAGCGP